jgi:hypothetical protein
MDNPEKMLSAEDIKTLIDKNSYFFIKRKVPDEIIYGKYANDFAKITLTQNTSKDPVVYEGPGTLYQDENGVFCLKVYHVYTEGNPVNIFRKSTKIGKLIGKENYFKLEATDMSGSDWYAEDVWVPENITIPSCGTVLKIKLNELSKTVNHPETNNKFEIEMMIIGKYETPYSEWVSFSNGSQARIRHIINYCGITIATMCTKEALYIQIEGNYKSYKKDFYKIVLEAIGVALGLQLNPSTINTTINGENKFELKNVDLFDAKLNQPIPTMQAKYGICFSEFIVKYLDTFNQPWCSLYMNWLKIYRSSSTSFENTALIQCIAIEGVLKEYFKKKGIPDSHEITSIDSAVKVINDSQIDSKMIERIISMVSTIKNQNPRRALKELCEEGYITKDMIKAWNNRNSLAHGKLFSNSKSFNLQNAIDDSDKVLALFYRLLFLTIDYKGQIRDYSTEGWPIISMPKGKI